MADWVPVAGSTFLVPSGPSGYHLHVVLNDPCVFDGYGPVCCVVMVGFTSKVNGAPYDGEKLVSRRWNWPNNTYLQRRLKFVRSQQMAESPHLN